MIIFGVMLGVSLSLAPFWAPLGALFVPLWCDFGCLLVVLGVSFAPLGFISSPLGTFFCLLAVAVAVAVAEGRGWM